MLYGKIDRKDLFDFLRYQANIDTAKEVFGNTQPQIIQTGWYSTPSWNWSYQVGFCDVMIDVIAPGGKGQIPYAMEQELQLFEVVTQFGEVKAARRVYFYNTK